MATRGKKASGTLLVDITAATAVPLSAYLSPLVITTKLAAAILGGPLFGRGFLPAQYCPYDWSRALAHNVYSPRLEPTCSPFTHRPPSALPPERLVPG